MTPNFNKHTRKLDVLSTFFKPDEPYRAFILEKIKESNIFHKNVNNCFDNKELQELYSNTKILINVHQTKDHQTFEELRALPALLCGCLIISEESPLQELIPYHKYIIWTTSYLNSFVFESLPRIRNSL